MTYRCLVVDDEPLARKVLANHLSKMPSLELVGECANAVEAVARDTTFHPVRDYLGGLEWDGEERVVSFAANYLGAEREAWRRYDACELVGASGWSSPIRVDQGAADTFLEEQLKPELFRQACQDAGVELDLHVHEGYDHSYYFIASFMEDHVAHHARLLAA